MKVQELIDTLDAAVDKENSDVFIYWDGMYYEIESIGQFGIVTDVTIKLKSNKEEPK